MREDENEMRGLDPVPLEYRRPYRIMNGKKEYIGGPLPIGGPMVPGIVPRQAEVKPLPNGPRPLYRVDLCGNKYPLTPSRGAVNTQARGHEWVPGYFAGKTVYVIGSGPSMRGFDYSRLKGKTTIAVNQEIVFVPSPALWVYGDATTTGDARTMPSRVLPAKTVVMESTPTAHLPKKEQALLTVIRRQRNPNFVSLFYDTWGLFSRYTVSTFATSLALAAGAERVCLLGIDCGFIGGMGHHFSDGSANHPVFGKRRPHHMDNAPLKYERHIEDWKRMLCFADKLVNMSPQSRLAEILPTEKFK